MRVEWMPMATSATSCLAVNPSTQAELQYWIRLCPSTYFFRVLSIGGARRRESSFAVVVLGDEDERVSSEGGFSLVSEWMFLTALKWHNYMTDVERFFT
ncbi:Hypothetical predicted protein [Olea europaea subsp. europaea]|uniref:Uncharacterized protein n=1 Tax=Olea europaea subsp. europaea TaxID=158383 RepID=A0A8S0V6I5_OLEEU|nr:Hypothetical predicted protein [Olea europaea subsp. europaea]